MIVTLQQIEKSFGEHTVLSDVSAKIEAGDRIGMIGINGAGKSTLLNVISGRLPQDKGEVIWGKDVTFGYLRQNTPLTGGRTVYEEMEGVFTEQIALEKEMEQCRSELESATEEQSPRLLSRLQSLTQQFEAADGYNRGVRIAQVLTGLGFPSDWWNKIVDHLSGGERVRLSLAKLLLSAPDLLMLDEPTNHLDFSTLSFLENYINDYKGAVLMVSHDRYFLDKTVTRIWEVERTGVAVYPGNYTKYKVLREERRQTLQKEYDKAMTERAALEDYIARNLVRASTSAMAKSRRKQLEKLDIPTLPPPEHRGMQFAFDMGQKSGFDVLLAENLGVRIEDRQLFCQLYLDIKRGEKIAFVGQNGIGKTSLFRRLLDQLEGEGTVRWGKGVRIGYFDQHGSALSPELTPVEQIREDYPGDVDGVIRDLLARVNLKGEAVFAPISTLSGGQKAGVSFARLMRRADNVMLLDEPTNHLDLASRENLESALADYEGTLLMISHDRYLLSRVPSAIYCLSGAGLKRYDTLEDYQNALSEPPCVEKKVAKDNTSYHKDKKERARLAARRKRLSEIESKIACLEAENEELEAKLAEGSAEYQALQEYCERLAANKQLISDLTDEWLELEEE
ncbi:MAG: ABC-F family ATP-binding cassette domain-containing protein [Clostridia bacterium]|nr:ABC-F family ATP-binding cassette domain-containing protein [Clostridia bacterium]